ncbi:MAG: AAA family ATPase [Spirochaetes bacterium]|nr:AAA family ATPase [Spirochaetota bacterium]
MKHQTYKHDSNSAGIQATFLEDKASLQVQNEKSMENEILGDSQRWDLLEHAAQQLKQEFFGLDSVIDKVIASVTGWFLCSHLQERPMVVNLWGLTGVGKTALVRRLAELLGCTQSCFRINLAELGSDDFTVSNEAFCQIDGKPAVLILDEFQHFRTKNANGDEREHKTFVWDLLDTGRVEITKIPDDYATANSFIRDLKQALDCGVRVAGNRVLSGRETLNRMVNFKHYWREFTHTGVRLHYRGSPFIPDAMLESLRELFKEKFSTIFMMKEALKLLDGEGCLTLIRGLLKQVKFVSTIDCRQTLVFVIGNIDELHEEANELNPDLDPDLFRERTLAFTMANIKEALLCRFRAEQIARLGNVHIIYPSLGSQAYRRVIAAELHRLAERTLQESQVSLRFDDKVHEYLFRDGVVPSQGTRPLFSTIHAHIGRNIARVFAERGRLGMPVQEIRFTYDRGSLVADFYTGQDAAPHHRMMLALERHIEADRAYTPGAESALVAVHEAGHAVVSMAYSGLVPTSVQVNSAANRGEGFVEVHRELALTTYQALLGRLAVLLAGSLAETIVFGKENQGMGSHSDISSATSLAAQAVRQYGLGQSLGRFMSEGADGNDQFLRDRAGAIQEEIENLLLKAQAIACDFLSREGTFLIELARRLHERGSLRAEDLCELARKYGGRLVNGEAYCQPYDYQATLRLSNFPFREI